MMGAETLEQEAEVVPSHWAACPRCGVDRADYEQHGRHLPECPNCHSALDPVIQLYIIDLDWTERYHRGQPNLDAVELILSIAEQAIQAEVFSGYVVSDAQKWELHDALSKLIDERVAAALKR